MYGMTLHVERFDSKYNDYSRVERKQRENKRIDHQLNIIKL